MGPYVHRIEARVIPAPELAEVAGIWWDRDVVPVVCWHDDGSGTQVVELVDPTALGGDADPRAVPAASRLLLARVPGRAHTHVEAAAIPDVAAIAQILADGLAACDFPPTGTAASPSRVAATLRAAGVVLPAPDAAGPSGGPR